MRVILDVFGGSGSWSTPYAEAGYDVLVIDLTRDIDVCEYHPPKAHGVLVAPPCTEFAVSGARWWAGKGGDMPPLGGGGPAYLEDAISLVRHGLRIIRESNAKWWALENPVGRLWRCVPELGKHRYTFQPWEYGDDMVKRTCIWGEHVQPVKTPIEPSANADWVHRLPPSSERAALRSVTPGGFARAFYEANP